ncbi:MAG: exonuclease domain-containing protein, partial [Dehalococcoidia bacterium]
MKDWKNETIPALDFESTGLDPLTARIVQVALVFVAPDGALEPRSWTAIVDPGVEIPAEASTVHGITTEIAREQGISPAEALRHLSEPLEEIEAERKPLVIYNAPYDWPLLLSEAGRHHVAVPAVPIVDPLVCDHAVDRYRRGRRTLDDVARHYGCALEN